MRKLALLSLLVQDYDEAIAYYTQVLRFHLFEDRDLSDEQPGKRWVEVGPSADPAAARFLLARAANDEQRAAVGRQTGGRVFLFLHTDDFERDYAHLQAHGVSFCGTPRDEPYGRMVVFLDLYGNKWDLIEPR